MLFIPPSLLSSLPSSLPSYLAEKILDDPQDLLAYTLHPPIHWGKKKGGYKKFG